MKPAKLIAKLTAFGIAATALLLTSAAEAAEGKAVVRTLRGTAEFSDQDAAWKNLAVGKVLAPTSKIKTALGSQVDLFLGENGPMLRLMENTTLTLEKMNANPVGPGVFIIETSLDLKAGMISGNTKMMLGPSKYEVKTPFTSCLIRDAEYKISADGTHQVTRGSATITYKDSQGVATTKTISAGETFVLPKASPEAKPAQP
jgi:hypothetical protein